MKPTTVIGIDVGKSGGLAVIHEDYKVETFKMPETERDISNLIEDLSHLPNPFAYIEKVNSMPGQGIVSAWKFSGNYHGLRMTLICHKIPFDEVRPQVWQKGLGIVKRAKTESKVQFKNRLKAKAQQLFPSCTVTHAIGDALLISEYGFRLSGQ